MKLIVNPHKIEIVKELVNEKEIDITKCEFEFSEEITDDFVKEAYFTLNNETYKQMIENNECKIPYEVLKEKGQVEIGCVAFLVENEQEIKRYNPSPVYISTLAGSLKDEFENSEPITPTDKEQIEQMLNNINVDANKQGKITTITITFKDGTTKDVTLEDGMGIDYNWVGTQLGIKREDEQEYEYVDLKGEKGDAGAIRMRIVQELPFVGDEDTMYLVPLEEPETEDNRYAEYIYVNNQWELLGKIGIQVDLSDYYTKSQVYNKEETDTKVNAKYTKPSDGIPKEDLTQSVQTSLDKADSSIQDVSGKEDKSNKVTSLSSSSTDTQYPSAKCVYDSQETQTNDIQYLQEKNNELKGIINNIYDIDNYLIKNHSIESEETTESITLNNTMNKAPMSLTLKGNIEQDGEPTPTNPVDIHIVSGDNEIKVENRNRLNIDNLNLLYQSGASYTKINTGIRAILKVTGNNRSIVFFVGKSKDLLNKTIRLKTTATASASNNFRYYLGYCNNDGLNRTAVISSTENGTTLSMLVERTDIENICLGLYANVDGTNNVDDYVDYSNLIITIDDEDMSYVAHQEYTKEINLGDLEVGGIGEYEDEFFKNTIDSEYYDSTLEQDKWYLKKRIGKVVLDGTQNVTRGDTSTSGSYRFNIATPFTIDSGDNNYVPNILCNRLTKISRNQTYSNVVGVSSNPNAIQVYMEETKTMSADGFKTWLSSNNIITYCKLATPENILLNDTLQETLDSFVSYQEQTNISQTNNDLPFVIKARAIREIL